MPGGEGMAPSSLRQGGGVRKEKGEGLRLLRRITLDTRQDGEGDGRNRGGGRNGGGSRGGGGGGGGGGGFRGGGSSGNDDSGSRFGGGRNRGGGGNNNDNSDDEGDGGNRGGGFGRNRGGNNRGGGGGGRGGDSDNKGTTEAVASPTEPSPPAETTAVAVPAAPPAATTAVVAPPPEPTTVVQISTMTITPSVNPNTVTTFIPQPLVTTEGAAVAPVPVPGDTTSTASLDTPAPTVSSDSGPAPTALPDQGTTPLALTPAVSTTAMPDGGNILVGGGGAGLGLGDNPATPTSSAGTASEATPTDAPQGMDPMAERAMISVGSIAAFVMIVSIVWLVFRRIKRKKDNSSSSNSGSSTLNFHKFLPKGLTFRLPFKTNSSDRAWENLGDSNSVKDRPPTYSSAKAIPKKSLPLGGFYGHEKAYPYHPEDARQEKKERLPQLPRLQTTGIPAASQLPAHTPSSAKPLSSHPVSALSSNPVSAARSTRGDISANTTSASTVAQFSHQAQESFSSTNAAQFGSMSAGGGASTLHPSAGSGHYSQSNLGRTPSAGRRQVHRASEISSLSSGFGDGDIIVPGVPPVPVPQLPANAYSGTGTSTNGYPRFSWMSQETGKRDTVYTQASEDMPPRFRTVNSWVDQQTGRIKRAQQQPQSSAPPVPNVPGVVGIPGIHNPPHEQGFDMMMDDEQPRRMEDTLPAKS